MKMPVLIPAIKPVMLEAITQPLQIDLQRAAVIVINMQNAFASDLKNNDEVKTKYLSVAR
jgi:isochorismate hydrolase